MFHKEGYKIIFIALVSFIAALLLADKFIHLAWLKMTVQLLVLFFFVMILQFFRNPNRKINPNKNTILAPVDGKVVVIEETEEGEYFKDKLTEASRLLKEAADYSDNPSLKKYLLSSTCSRVFRGYH